MGSSTVRRSDGLDTALVERLQQLHVALVSDALDHVGAKDRVLAAHIRPLWPGSRVAGFAATVHVTQAPSEPAERRDAYKRELAAVDSLQPGDVMVVSHAPGAAYWGELLTTACVQRQAHGLVGDVYARDTDALRALGFPAFVAGADPRDSFGRLQVDDVRVPIECGGVTVHPGDLVCGDDDGVVVVPFELAEQVLVLAEQKQSTERAMREDLRRGMSISDAFAIYDVL